MYLNKNFCCHVQSTKSLTAIQNLYEICNASKNLGSFITSNFFSTFLSKLGLLIPSILLFVLHSISGYYSIFRQLVWIYLVSHGFKVSACRSMTAFFLARRSIPHKTAKERKNVMTKYPFQSLLNWHLLVQSKERKHRSNM